MRYLPRIILVCTFMLAAKLDAASWVSTSRHPGQSNQEEIVSIAAAGEGLTIYVVTKPAAGTNILGAPLTTLWKSQDGGLSWATLSHRK
ncbi:MAG: hypothetical protein ACKORB_07095 [Opitutia bacterium]